MAEIEREKTIEGLKRYLNYPKPLCDVAQQAITLLKEQEPKSVCWRLGRAHCPSCGELFPKKQDKQYIRFCNWCGQEVKWNG